MVKKIFLLIVLMLLVSACTNKKEINEVKQSDESDNHPSEMEEEKKYIDNNNTEIGIYYSYNLVTTYKTNLVNSKDIVVFDIYPSNEEHIERQNYINNLYDEYTSLDNYKNLRIGFNLKYTLNTGEEISYNIFDPDSARRYDIGHIMAWLYDDYKHRYDSWYSHIEQDEYNDGDKLFTSIKLYSSDIENIDSKIILTVFTYDGEDDFDENGNYRGNSSYSVEICDINKTC